MEFAVVILAIVLILLWVAWDSVGIPNPYQRSKHK